MIKTNNLLINFLFYLLVEIGIFVTNVENVENEGKTNCCEVLNTTALSSKCSNNELLFDNDFLFVNFKHFLNNEVKPKDNSSSMVLYGRMCFKFNLKFTYNCN